MALSGQAGVTIPIKATNQATPVIAQVRQKLNGLLGGVGSQSVSVTKKMGAQWGGMAVTAAIKTMGLTMAWKEVYGKVMEASYEAKRFVVMGKRFGMPAAEMAKLSRYAETAGLNVGTMGRGMLMLQKFAQDGIGGATGQTKELIDKLGLSQTDLEEVRKGGMNAFIKIREAMGDMMSEGEQMAVWQQLIGQRAFEMAEFLKKSPEEMKEATSGAVGMSERVIQGLASGQKAYADFQAEVSKAFGELAHDLSWLFVAIGIILRGLLAASRIIRLLVVLQKTLVKYAISFARILVGDIAGGTKMASEATTELAETWKEVNADLKRDNDAIFGKNSPVVANAQATVRATKRTYEEIAKYNEAIKKLKEDQFKTDMDNAWNEEVKLDLMDAELKKIEEQTEALKKKYGDEYEMTEDFLKLDNRRLEIEKERDELSKKSYQKGQDLALRKFTQDVDFKVATRQAGYENADFWNFQKAFEGARLAGARYKDVLNDDKSGINDKIAARLDYEEALNDARKQAYDMGNQKPNTPVDNLQSIAGGGAIGNATSGNLDKAQLQQLEAQTKKLTDIENELRALNEKRSTTGYGVPSAFQRTTSTGRHAVRGAQLTASGEAAARAAEAARIQRQNAEAENEPIDPAMAAATRARVEQWKREEEAERRRRSQPTFMPYG